MEKTKDAVKQQLREDWEKACNGYLVELLRMWELDGHYGYWIGEDVGGVYDYGGDMCIGMDDIIYCVEHDVTEEEYREWSDYCVEASEFGFDTPNLKSWHMGCPRTPKETFGHLRILKKNLADAVEEEKQRMKQ
jgi:hypothetical protein